MPFDRVSEYRRWKHNSLVEYAKEAGIYRPEEDPDNLPQNDFVGKDVICELCQATLSFHVQTDSYPVPFAFMHRECWEAIAPAMRMTLGIVRAEKQGRQLY